MTTTLVRPTCGSVIDRRPRGESVHVRGDENVSVAHQRAGRFVAVGSPRRQFRYVVYNQP